MCGRRGGARRRDRAREAPWRSRARCSTDGRPSSRRPFARRRDAPPPLDELHPSRHRRVTPRGGPGRAGRSTCTRSPGRRRPRCREMRRDSSRASRRNRGTTPGGRRAAGAARTARAAPWRSTAGPESGSWARETLPRAAASSSHSVRWGGNRRRGAGRSRRPPRWPASTRREDRGGSRSAISRAQGVDRVRQPLGFRRRGAEILIRAKRQKRAVGGAVFGGARRVVAAIGCATAFDAGEDLPAGCRARRRKGALVSALSGNRLRDQGPAPCQTGQVDEIEPGAVAEAREVRVNVLDGSRPAARSARRVRRRCNRGRSRRRDPGKPPSGLPVAQERCDEVARLTELRGRQPGDLQHLESQTHCTSP